MLAVLSRFKLLFIILLIILTAVLVWIYIAIQDGDRDFSKGVFVMNQNGIGYCKDGKCTEGYSAGAGFKRGIYVNYYGWEGSNGV